MLKEVKCHQQVWRLLRSQVMCGQEKKLYFDNMEVIDVLLNDSFNIIWMQALL